MNDLHDLKLILNSHVPLIVIETHEETRALHLLCSAAGDENKPCAKWTVTDGLETVTGTGLRLDDLALVDREQNGPPVKATTDPQTALRRIKDQSLPGVFALLDFHHHLDDPIIIRLIKEIALDYSVSGHTLVLISHALNVPDELSRYSARFEISMPDQDKLKKLLLDESKVWALKNDGSRVKADPRAMDLLINNLLGLTATDAQRLIRNAIYDDGAITHADIPDVQKAKYQLIGRDGLLSFEYDTARFNEVGGLHNLKQWLERRRVHFAQSNNESTLDSPKGILLVGVQGGGKSLAAKAVAGVWGVPLLRLDFGVLYNKFFGETEKNTREALKLAEVMSPCVLWIDEIEKGISTGDYDSGTSQRVLGTLLTWMAETKAKVFIVATANDIQALPPELIRKGRLDEIFFVDLPSPEVREEIFAIHLKKRNHDPRDFDLGLLAGKSNGFSGAEIEQAVVAARYTAHAQQTALNTQHVIEEIAQTRPLSVVMSEKLNRLRQWAEDRTVAAG